jgi:hypothetical protein
MERLVLLNDRADDGEGGEDKQQKYDRFQRDKEIPYPFHKISFFCCRFFVSGQWELAFANKKALL